MRANRRQSLAEFCNPKLVRLAQVPHRTADREVPKLARRKWQPPHNMGEPQTENALDNTFKHRNCHQVDRGRRLYFHLNRVSLFGSRWGFAPTVASANVNLRNISRLLNSILVSFCSLQQNVSEVYFGGAASWLPTIGPHPFLTSWPTSIFACKLVFLIVRFCNVIHIRLSYLEYSQCQDYIEFQWITQVSDFACSTVLYFQFLYILFICRLQPRLIDFLPSFLSDLYVQHFVQAKIYLSYFPWLHNYL